MVIPLLFGGLRSVPFALYRSGTSRGLFLLEKDVPPRGPARDELISRLMGSGHPQQIGGFGGGCGPTSKAVVVGPHSEPGSVTYSFLQCHVDKIGVDSSHGDCGNMLAAVAPFALEQGLVKASEADSTSVTIHSLNTGALYVAEVLGGSASSADVAALVSYEGDCEVSGVPSPAAPVRLSALGVAGSQTGKLLPTLQAVDHFDLGEGLGLAKATLVDFARALVLVDAADVLPKFGYSSLAEVTLAKVADDAPLCKALEHVRLAAASAMGMGDCTGKDAPKLALVAPASTASDAKGGILACRYFVNPGRRELHPTVAMTAAQGVGSACLVEGSVAAQALGRRPQPDGEGGTDASSFSFLIEHPQGTFPVSIGTTPASAEHSEFPQGTPHAGRYTTTVMPIAVGQAFVPSSLTR